MAVVETRYAVPGWGVGAVWLEDDVLRAHDFHFEPAGRAAPSAAPLQGADGPPTGTVPANPSHVVSGFVTNPRQPPPGVVAAALIQRIRAFLAGRQVDFGDVELDLEWATPLQRAIVNALRSVPRGEIVSYGELAALAGRPRAPRAAGAVCARNRYAFVVPCHRVVAAHGIGGYGEAGVDVKRRLLALEGVAL